MALLNSRLCWWFLTNTGTTLANGFFRFKPDYIKPFPVPSNSITCTAIEQVEQLVNEVFQAKKDGDIETMHSKETQIDSIIYNIYGLTYDEVLIVDPETTISREEYELKK